MILTKRITLVTLAVCYHMHVVAYNMNEVTNTGVNGCVLSHEVAYNIDGENSTGNTGC